MEFQVLGENVFMANAIKKNTNTLQTLIKQSKNSDWSPIDFETETDSKILLSLNLKENFFIAHETQDSLLGQNLPDFLIATS